VDEFLKGYAVGNRTTTSRNRRHGRGLTASRLRGRSRGFAPDGSDTVPRPESDAPWTTCGRVEAAGNGSSSVRPRRREFTGTAFGNRQCRRSRGSGFRRAPSRARVVMDGVAEQVRPTRRFRAAAGVAQAPRGLRIARQGLIVAGVHTIRPPRPAKPPRGRAHRASLEPDAGSGASVSALDRPLLLASPAASTQDRSSRSDRRSPRDPTRRPRSSGSARRWTGRCGARASVGERTGPAGTRTVASGPFDKPSETCPRAPELVVEGRRGSEAGS